MPLVCQSQAVLEDRWVSTSFLPTLLLTIFDLCITMNAGVWEPEKKPEKSAVLDYMVLFLLRALLNMIYYMDFSFVFWKNSGSISIHYLLGHYLKMKLLTIQEQPISFINWFTLGLSQ